MFTFRSPAKLNLFFRILSKRSDQFHEILSIYQAIDLFDLIKIQISDEDRFSCSDPKLITPDNLVLKALQIFREKTTIDQKVSIHLKKNIPIGSGLGGGSSNAATALWGLNQIFKTNFSKSALMEFSKPLGADVPFFFSCGSAICKGKGDVVKDVKLPTYRGWIIHPNIHIKTPDVYKRVFLDKVSKTPIEKLIDSFKNNSPIFMNDLENPAFIVEPKLKKIKESFPHATLTGSGSCFFSFVEPKQIQEAYFPFQSVSCADDDWY